MALFQYFALNPSGKKIAGLINADSLELAKEELRKQKVLVTKLVLYKKQPQNHTLAPTLILGLTRDLHVLLRAGLPLYDSLLTLREKYDRTKAASLLLNLCDRVKEGQHLSEALEVYPRVFDPVYLAMVKAGEETGSLTRSFAELSKLISRTERLKKKLSSAMIYPLFLAVFCAIVIGVLLFFLIPSMQELFEGRYLHPLTQTVLSISLFLNGHALLFFSSLLLLILFITFWMKQKKGKIFREKLYLKLPLLKRLVIEAVMTRFCRVFSVLLHGGLSLLDSLKLAKLVMHHSLFEKGISQAEAKVIEGHRLSEQLKKNPLFPLLVIRMMAIAEESGEMSKMVEHIGEIYEEDLERSLTRLTSFLQPIILLFLGVVVAIILLSVLLPLTDVSSMMN
jgi:general secretion pathway protein F